MLKPPDKELLRFAEEIQPLYQLLKWEWTVMDEKGIPTVDMLYRKIWFLVDEYFQDFVDNKTGGLFVGKHQFIPDTFSYGFKLERTACDFCK